MGWLEAISGFFKIINTLFTMMREKELRKQGYKKAKEEIEIRKQKNREIADQVNDSPDVPTPWDGLWSHSYHGSRPLLVHASEVHNSH